VIALALCAALAGAQEAPALAPTGKIAAVTVFPSRAAVTRVVEVELVKGMNDVRFEDLPPTLQEDSLQAEGAGVDGARILGLDVASRELVEDRRTRVAELETKIRDVADQISAHRDARTAAQAELAFLTKLQSAAAKQLSAELLFVDGTVADAAAVAELLRTRVPEVQEQIRKANVDERDSNAQKSALQRELNGVRSAGQWSRRDVMVQIESPNAGTATVELTYILPGASWGASYDARADLDDNKIALTLHALVTQTTGEDWANAELTLSTARPTGGVSPPSLDPYWLESYQAQDYGYLSSGGGGGYGDDDFGGVADDMDEMMIESDKKEKGRGAAPPPPPPMAVQRAKVVEHAVATAFIVPGESTVPGDGTRRKLRITDADLDATFVHIAVPRIEEAAFLIGRTEWGQPWPMLAGRVSSFVDDAFVGTQNVGLTGQGSEVELGFGRDDAVQITRQIQVDLTSGNKKVTVERGWTLEVKNGRSKPVTVELLDRVPVPRESRFKVERTGDEPTETTPDGLVTWVRELAADAEASVAFGYEVKYPAKYPPGGMP